MAFWKKKEEFCIICKRKLEHKYKPHKEWDINGMLCSDCHILKTKEYIIKNQLEKEKQEIYLKLGSKGLPFEDLQQLTERIGVITNMIDEKEMRWLELSENAS